MTNYLLMKRGLYWRPNGQGYTGLKHEAGRYSKEQAWAWADHDRTDTTAILEDDAPSFAPGYSIDVIDLVARLRRAAKAAHKKNEGNGSGVWCESAACNDLAADRIEKLEGVLRSAKELIDAVLSPREEASA